MPLTEAGANILTTIPAPDMDDYIHEPIRDWEMQILQRMGFRTFTPLDSACQIIWIGICFQTMLIQTLWLAKGTLV